MNLLQETSDYWKAISNENYEFDSKKKLIRFIESVTPEEVN
jgi:secreted Zn-dependent insulinase-like peptidase